MKGANWVWTSGGKSAWARSSGRTPRTAPAKTREFKKPTAALTAPAMSIQIRAVDIVAVGF